MPSIFPSPTSPTGAPSQPQGAPGDAIPNALGYRHPRYYAQVESGPGTNSWSSSKLLDWREVVQNQDGQDDSAQFVIGMLDSDRAYQATNPQDWDSWLQRLQADRRLRVVSPVGGGTVLFQGYPMVSNLAWQPGTHSMAVTAISEGQEWARTNRQAQIAGRAMRRRPWVDWRQVAPDDQLVDSLPCAFNAGGLPNRTADIYPVENAEGITKVHWFDNDGGVDAAYWTFAQALRYLVFRYVMAAGGRVKGIPFMEDTDAIREAEDGEANSDPLLAKLNARVPDVSVESLSVDEAVRALTARAGLHYRWAIFPTVNTENNQTDFKLRVYSTIANAQEEAATDPTGTSQMGAPKALPLRKQKAFADISADTPRQIAEANRIQAASIIRDSRGFNGVVARGGVFEYEVAVLLRPGWFPSQKLDNITYISAGQDDPPSTGVSWDEAVKYWRGEFSPEYAIDTLLGLQTRIPTSKFHALHPEHASAVDPNPIPPDPDIPEDPPNPASKVSDVFRLWVFPDTTSYMNESDESDYARPPISKQNEFDASWYKPFDPATELSIYGDTLKGAGLASVVTETWVPRNRAFRNLIGRRNLSSTDQSPMVLINFIDSTIASAVAGLSAAPSVSNWIEYAGAVEIDQSRAAIRFTEPNIWDGTPFLAIPNLGALASDKAMELYMRGQFWVAIVATVQSDFRLGDHEISSQDWTHTRDRVRTIDYGLERFRERLLDMGNQTILSHVPETNPLYLDRDDFFAFSDQREADAKFLAVQKWAGDPEAWFVETEMGVGDSATAIDGMGIDFVPYTSVQSVRYVKNAASGGSYRTTFHLTDLRTAPEVNSE